MIPETKKAGEITKRERESRGAPAPLRVLIVAPSLDILGGQAVQAARLLEGLRDEASLRVDFLPINPRLPGLFRWLQSIKYVRTLVTSLAYLTTLLVRVPRYDLLHIFSASYFSFVLAPTPAILVGKLYGKKLVLNYHSGEAADHLARWRRTAIPTIRQADVTVVQTNYLVDVFARFRLAARAIPNHLETKRLGFRERKSLRPVFLSNRNLESHYNVGCVLRAFSLVQEKFEDARLIVAGDGSQRSELEALAQQLNLRHTEFLGLVSPEQMSELYDEADIFLNGSEIDSMPLSILEAFAAGLAVVTTDAGGIPWLVTDGETGLIVPRGDHQSLAKSCLRLLADERLATALVNNARRECEKYSWPTVRDQWLRLYDEVALGKAFEQGTNGERQALDETQQRAISGAQSLSDDEQALSAEREAVRP